MEITAGSARLAASELLIADLALRHLAAPSLGHYALLSFVVKGVLE